MKLNTISRCLFALAAVTFVITYRESRAQSPSNDLLAFYSFSGNANDESGHGHNGIVHGATLVDDQFETTNSAYSFVAPKSYLQIDHFSSSNFDSDFTINLVARFSSFNTDFPQLIESSNLFLALSAMGPTYNSNPVNGNGYGHVQFYLDKDADHSESSHIGRVISKTVFQTNRFYTITVKRLDNIISMFVNGSFESASLQITNRVLNGDVLTLGGRCSLGVARTCPSKDLLTRLKSITVHSAIPKSRGFMSLNQGCGHRFRLCRAKRA